MFSVNKNLNKVIDNCKWQINQILQEWTQGIIGIMLSAMVYLAYPHETRILAFIYPHFLYFLPAF